MPRGASAAKRVNYCLLADASKLCTLLCGVRIEMLPQQCYALVRYCLVGCVLRCYLSSDALWCVTAWWGAYWDVTSAVLCFGALLPGGVRIEMLPQQWCALVRYCLVACVLRCYLSSDALWFVTAWCGAYSDVSSAVLRFGAFLSGGVRIKMFPLLCYALVRYCLVWCVLRCYLSSDELWCVTAWWGAYWDVTSAVMPFGSLLPGGVRGNMWTFIPCGDIWTFFFVIMYTFFI